MSPDFLLECTVCGSEAAWDTDAVPPVGLPEVGHPVLWYCQACAAERRHTIVDLYVLIDKLHREICIATELERETVDRVMGEVYQHRPPAVATILMASSAIHVLPDPVGAVTIQSPSRMASRARS